MKLHEIVDERDDTEPLLITIIRQRLEKGEPISYESKEQNDFGSWRTKSYQLRAIKRRGGDAHGDRTVFSFSGMHNLDLTIDDELLERKGWTLTARQGGWQLERGKEPPSYGH